MAGCCEHGNELFVFNSLRLYMCVYIFLKLSIAVHKTRVIPLNSYAFRSRSQSSVGIILFPFAQNWVLELGVVMNFDRV